MNDSDPSALMHSNLSEIFGQRDAARRHEAMRRTYAEDIAFTDPEGTVHGYDAVDKQVNNVLDKAPESFVFAPDGPLYLLADTRAALPWAFGPASGTAVARGIDIATIADGRITFLLTLLAPQTT
jgi:SnoaL-like domain